MRLRFALLALLAFLGSCDPFDPPFGDTEVDDATLIGGYSIRPPNEIGMSEARNLSAWASFNADGSYSFSENDDESGIRLSHSGTWRSEGSTIWIHVQRLDRYPDHGTPPTLPDTVQVPHGDDERYTWITMSGHKLWKQP